MTNLELYQIGAYFLYKKIRKTYGVSIAPEYIINETTAMSAYNNNGSHLFVFTTWHGHDYITIASKADVVAKTCVPKRYKKLQKTKEQTSMICPDAKNFYYTFSYKYSDDSKVRHAEMVSPTYMTKGEFIQHLKGENYAWFKIGTYTNRQWYANYMRRKVKM